MAVYFHVYVETKSGEKFYYDYDLNEKNLKEITNSLNENKEITGNGKKIDLNNSDKINIFRTNESLFDYFNNRHCPGTDKEFKDWFKNPEQPPRFPMYEEDDVTSLYLKKNPGQSSSFKKFKMNPWTVTIIGGLIVLIIARLVLKG